MMVDNNPDVGTIRESLFPKIFHQLKKRYRIIYFCGLILPFFVSCSKDIPPTKPSHYPKPYKVLGKWYQPLPDAKGFKQRGVASWYGKKFHGRKTSNGEIYDMYAMTAAHKTLPLGTYVRVRNLENNKTIDVRINDRGPFVRGRVVDLSYTAAKKIDIVGPGTAPVEVIALGVAGPAKGSRRSYTPVDYYSGNFTIQVGSFGNRKNAERLKEQLDKKYNNVHITTFDSGSGIFHRVRIGKFSDLKKVEENESFLIKNGFPDAFTVAE
jgi:rare lipoprotein A